MSKLGEMAGDVRRTRRNLTKAAGVALTALLALSVKPKSALAQHHEEHRCFLKGTRIRTVEGYRRVEELRIGDFLPTTFGGITPIEWIGSYGFKKSDPSEAWAKDAMPVRIMRSALDDNVPSADLCLTAAHALYVDGVLVPVGNLINGTTIVLDDADEFDELEYFHIKLENHDVIDAEGASCETLLEIDETANNFAEYVRRYGAPKAGETSCAPLLGFNGGRNETKSRLRSAFSPWVDRREKLDIIRDRLEERGIALCRILPSVKTGPQRPSA